MSAEYVVELLQVPVNDTFTAKPEIFANLREGAKAAGVSGQEYGLTVEDSSKLYWVIHYEGELRPKDFQWPKEYGDWREAIGAISTSTGHPKALYALIKEKFPKSITNAPITETVTINIRPDTDKAECTKLMDVFIGEAVRSAEGCRGALWVFASEDHKEFTNANTVICYVGWDSLEAHDNCAKTEAFGKHVSPLVPFIIGRNMAHVKYAEA